MDRKRHQTCLHLNTVGKASPIAGWVYTSQNASSFCAPWCIFFKIIQGLYYLVIPDSQGISLSDKHKIRIQSILLLQSFLTHLLLQPWNSWGRFFYRALGSLSTALRQSGFTIEYKETSQARKCLDAFAFRFYFVKSLLPFVNAAFILKSMLLYLFLWSYGQREVCRWQLWRICTDSPALGPLRIAFDIFGCVRSGKKHIGEWRAQ